MGGRIHPRPASPRPDQARGQAAGRNLRPLLRRPTELGSRRTRPLSRWKPAGSTQHHCAVASPSYLATAPRSGRAVMTTPCRPTYTRATTRTTTNDTARSGRPVHQRGGAHRPYESEARKNSCQAGPCLPLSLPPPAAERNPESDPQLAELTEAREARIVAERDLAALERKLDQQ